MRAAMSESEQPPGDRELRHKEYEDPHYHDEDEAGGPPSDDAERPRAPKLRKPSRKLPPPRRYED